MCAYAPSVIESHRTRMVGTISNLDVMGASFAAHWLSVLWREGHRCRADVVNDVVNIRSYRTDISEWQGLYLESSNELCKVRIETYFGL
jgi:hypothetical protein